MSLYRFFFKHDEQGYCVVILGLFGFLRSESSILGVFEMEEACKLKMKDMKNVRWHYCTTYIKKKPVYERADQFFNLGDFFDHL